MAFTLYEINAQIEALYGKAVDPDTGEVVDEALFSLLDACEVEREEKILYICTRIKSLQAEADACRNEAKKLKLQSGSVRQQSRSRQGVHRPEPPRG